MNAAAALQHGSEVSHAPPMLTYDASEAPRCPQGSVFLPRPFDMHCTHIHYAVLGVCYAYLTQHLGNQHSHVHHQLCFLACAVLQNVAIMKSIKLRNSFVESWIPLAGFQPIDLPVTVLTRDDASVAGSWTEAYKFSGRINVYQVQLQKCCNWDVWCAFCHHQQQLMSYALLLLAMWGSCVEG